MSTTILIALLIGAVAGIIAALCGVGGGIVMVPAMVMFLGMPQKEAVATSLGAIILIALAGSWKNHTNALIDWPVAIACAVAGAIVAWFAADLLKVMSNEWLTRIFSILMILVGFRMLFMRT
jgi:uncharacterized membrane protein YfcA